LKRIFSWKKIRPKWIRKSFWTGDWTLTQKLHQMRTHVEEKRQKNREDQPPKRQ